MRLHSLIILTICLVGASACKRVSADTDEGRDGEKPYVVTSTTMLADMVSQLAGDHVNVVSIVSPGADPHLYQPTPRDARRLAQSDLVIRNGLTLEGWIDDLIDNAGGEREVVTAADSVEAMADPTGESAVDPHFWFDPTRWIQATETVQDSLRRVLPESAHDDLDARASAYRDELRALDRWIATMIETIPESQRVLVTSHDAFAYFGDRYGIQVVAIQGLSTEEEASQRDVANVIRTVRDANVPAVFVESSVNPRMIEQVARETGAKKAGPLYSDSTGPAGTDAATYVGMVEENVRLMVEALDGSYSPRLAHANSPEQEAAAQ